jgi:hypothetical protein
MANLRIKLPQGPKANAELEEERGELPDAPFKLLPHKAKPPTGSADERLWYAQRVAVLEQALVDIKYWANFPTATGREAIVRKCKDLLRTDG